MSAEPKKSTEAEEFLEFLNTLPEEDKKNATGKSDEEILEFLDELEANSGKKSDKKPDVVDVAPSAKSSEAANSVPATTEIPLDDDKEAPAADGAGAVDPIASISSWWSSEGSSKVTSLWGSAQARAEEALKLAKERGLDQQHIRKAFNEIVISEQQQAGEGSKEGDELKLPDAGKAMESLNRGFGLFSSRLGSVIDRLNTDLAEYASVEHDETLNIRLVHDLKNYHYVNSLIGSNFKKVMNSQVDGDLLIKVSDNHISEKNDDVYKRNLNIFHGKVGDCEKLILANLEESIKSAEQMDRQTNIFIGLHPVTIPSSTVSDSTDTDQINIDSYTPGNFSFIIMLKDTTHDLTIVTKSQPFPMKWANWVDGSTEANAEEKPDGEDAEAPIDVDPSQWVKGWIRSGLDLSFGVLAQSYVIKRMGY